MVFETDRERSDKSDWRSPDVCLEAPLLLQEGEAKLLNAAISQPIHKRIKKGRSGVYQFFTNKKKQTPTAAT